MQLLMWIDERLFRIVNDLSGGPLDRIGVFFATLLLAAVVALACIPIIRTRRLAPTVRILCAAAVSFFAAQLIKQLIRRPRPFVTLEHVRVLVTEHARDWSFPSGHASVAFAVVFSLWFWQRRWGVRALVLALLVGLGRVFVGVHYPSDILGGALVGFLSAWIVSRF